MISMYTHIDVDVIGGKIFFYEMGRLIDRLLNRCWALQSALRQCLLLMVFYIHCIIKSELKSLDMLARWCSNNLMYKPGDFVTLSEQSPRVIFTRCQVDPFSSIRNMT